MQDIKPRKWQEEALRIWKKEKKGIIKVVTGGGKTFFASFCIEYLLKENIEDLKIIIFVPSLMLIDQWEVEINHFFKNALTISTCSGVDKPDLDAQVIISSLDSGEKLLEKLKEKKNIFCIVDECHRAGSEKRSQCIKHDWSYTLGLSATPEREHDDAFESILVPYLGEVFFNYNYLSALKDGVISKFDLVNVYVPLMDDEELEYNKATKKISKRIAVLGKFDMYDPYLKILLINRSRILNNAYLRAPTANKIINLIDSKKWLIFCEQIMQAEIMAELLNRKDLRVAKYHTKLSKLERYDNLSKFKDGIADVLISCKSLDEGFDVPDAESAIIVSSSASVRQRIQRMGRVLRITANKENALIVTVYSSNTEYVKLKEESNRYQLENVPIRWQQMK